MRKVELKVKEELKYNVIKEVVHHGLNKKAAAVKLGCSLRSVNRYIHIFKEKGKEGFVHGNRGRKPAITFPEDFRKAVIQLYQDEYQDVSFTQFAEFIQEDFHMSISPNTLANWFKDAFICSPLCHKKTRTRMKRLLKDKIENSHSRKEKTSLQIKEDNLYALDVRDAHPRRPRRENAGEMIQMDASVLQWSPLTEEKWHLHLAVDDASNTVVGAWFDHQETLSGYYHVLEQILTGYGIPCLIYTDKRTVFEYKQHNKKTQRDDKDTFTQFGYACHQLGIDIKTTSVSQAKGRVERLNKTFQNRLPAELKRHHIKTIEEANEFLASYLRKFNERFSIKLDARRTAYSQLPHDIHLDNVLSTLIPRKVDTGHCIKVDNKYYLPVDAYGNPRYFTSGTEGLFIRSYSGAEYISLGDEVYLAREIDKMTRDKYGKPKPGVPKQKRSYIPDQNHPWRRDMYLFFRNQIHGQYGY